jgi:hypothetical protein
MSRSTRFSFLLFVLVTATAAFAQSSAQKSFDHLKSLTGSWEGKASDGSQVQVSFHDTAGGSALISEIKGRESMITMFHLDGPNRLLMTHYCSAGNQPRMQASVSPDGKTLTFTFLDATNLASPEDGHMQQLVVAIQDADHHTEEWTFADHGKQLKEVFDLRRKM